MKTFILIAASGLAALAIAGSAAGMPADAGGHQWKHWTGSSDIIAECAVIDDAGHCAPAGFDPYGSARVGSVLDELALDSTGCRWKHMNMGWGGGSLGYQWSYNGYFRWCIKNGIVTKYSLGLSWSTGVMCSHANHTHYRTSGGTGTGHWDEFIQFSFSCGMPWGLPYNITHWINTRVTGSGTGWITNWKGKA